MHQEKNCVPHMHQAETAGRGLQPRPKPLLSDCRTGFATPSETFAFVDMQNIADGVANPVRHKSGTAPSGTSWINKNRQLRCIALCPLCVLCG